MSTTDSIAQLSGPFMSAKAEKKFRAYLGRLSEKMRGEKLADLQKDEARPHRGARVSISAAVTDAPLQRRISLHV